MCAQTRVFLNLNLLGAAGCRCGWARAGPATNLQRSAGGQGEEESRAPPLLLSTIHYTEQRHHRTRKKPGRGREGEGRVPLGQDRAAGRKRGGRQEGTNRTAERHWAGRDDQDATTTPLSTIHTTPPPSLNKSLTLAVPM